MRNNIKPRLLQPSYIEEETFSNTGHTQAKEVPEDKFNSSPNYMRVSSRFIPANQNLIRDSGIPFGVHITPLAHEEEIQQYSFGNNPIPQCENKKCDAFLNPYAEINLNKTWTCNLCSNSNVLDTNITFTSGTYEFFANSNFIERPPMAPAFLFLIDLSQKSIESGFALSVILSIKDLLCNKLFPDRAKFAIITYDTHITFYKFNQNSGSFHLLSIGGEEIFLPANEEDLLLNIEDNERSLKDLTDTLEMKYSNFSLNTVCKDSNKALLALEAASLLLKNNGGKILFLNTSISWKQTIISDGENLTFTQIERITKQLTANIISLDIFEVQIGKEVHNTSLLSDLANGNFYYYNHFNFNQHYRSVFNQIRRNITSNSAMEAYFTIKLNNRYKVKYLQRDSRIAGKEILSYPLIDPNATISALIEYNPEYKSNKNIIVNSDVLNLQSIVLYTHADGSRRIRIHNYSIPTCNRLNEYYTYLDVEASIMMITKMTILSSFERNISEALMAEVNHIYFNYAINKMKIIPEAKDKLYYFSKLYLSFLKNKIFCWSNQINFDNSMLTYLKLKQLQSDLDKGVNFLYPKMFNLCQDYLEYLSLTRNSLNEHGVYLIDNGHNIIIYFTKGREADKNVSDVLGKGMTFDRASKTLHNEDTIYEYDNELVNKLISQLEDIRAQSNTYQNLIFVFQDSPLEEILKECLIEDNLCPWYRCSFDEFLRK